MLFVDLICKIIVKHVKARLRFLYSKLQMSEGAYNTLIKFKWLFSNFSWSISDPRMQLFIYHCCYSSEYNALCMFFFMIYSIPILDLLSEISFHADVYVVVKN